MPKLFEDQPLTVRNILTIIGFIVILAGGVTVINSKANQSAVDLKADRIELIAVETKLVEARTLMKIELREDLRALGESIQAQNKKLDDLMSLMLKMSVRER